MEPRQRASLYGFACRAPCVTLPLGTRCHRCINIGEAPPSSTLAATISADRVLTPQPSKHTTITPSDHALPYLPNMMGPRLAHRVVRRGPRVGIYLPLWPTVCLRRRCRSGADRSRAVVHPVSRARSSVRRAVRHSSEVTLGSGRYDGLLVRSLAYALRTLCRAAQLLPHKPYGEHRACQSLERYSSPILSCLP